MNPERRRSSPWRAVLLWTTLAVALGSIAGAGAWAGVPAAGVRGRPPDAQQAAGVTAPTAAPRQQVRSPAGGAALGCEQCHGELELLRQQAGSLARAEQLLVPHRVVAGSAHGAMSCAECHTGYTRYPHAERGTQTRTCASCHAAAAEDWNHGSHAAADEQVGCVQCHGAHDIRTAAELRAPEGASAANAPCIGCHETARHERDVAHAEGVLCAACHAPHAVRPVHDPASWMSPALQAGTCANCHDSIAANWRQHDIHGNEALRREHLAGREPAAEAVLCTSCHAGHATVRPDDPRFAVASVERCAECHQHATRTFYGSYHGKATALGSRVSASCSDCHGAHDILPGNMAASRTARDNLVETCRACHEYARPAFVLYDTHPDPFNRARNPWIFFSFWMMNGLLVFVLLVFGAHTVLWWIRLWLDRRRGIVHGPGAHAHGHGTGRDVHAHAGADGGDA